MMFDHDKVVCDSSGTHHRGSVCLALVGNREVSIDWAMNALMVHLPVNAGRAMVTQPHPNLDTARNLVIEGWVRNRFTPTEHLFVWPSEQKIAWNAVVAAMESEQKVVKIGTAYCIRRDAIDDERGPWFKDGKWLGTTVKSMPQLILEPEQSLFTKELPPAFDADPEQIFVTCIPSLGKTSLPWVAHALQLAGPVASVRYLSLMVGREVADARQRLVDAALALKPRPAWLFFYGDDMLPSPSDLQMLFECARIHDLPAVAGLYAMKYEPPTQLLAWKMGTPGMLIAGRDFRPGQCSLREGCPCGAIEVDGTGLDFSLIRTEVIAKTPRPHFKTGLEFIEGKGVRIFTEDAAWWSNYTEATGRRPVLDTRVRVAHYNHLDGRYY